MYLCRNWIIGVAQQYCENFRKIEQAELVENLPPSYLPYRFLHNLHSFLLWGKVKILDFFKNQKLEWNFLCIGSYDKWFCIKSWQKFANLLLLCTAPGKKRLSKRCWKDSNNGLSCDSLSYDNHVIINDLLIVSLCIATSHVWVWIKSKKNDGNNECSGKSTLSIDPNQKKMLQDKGQSANHNCSRWYFEFFFLFQFSEKIRLDNSSASFACYHTDSM